MGMFDRLHDYNIRCPRCGSPTNYEIQTKDLVNDLTTFTVAYPKEMKKNDPLTDLLYHHTVHASKKLRKISATFTCKSPSCHAIASMIQYVKLGYISGFSLMWEIEYKVNKDGLVIGPAKFKSNESEDHKYYKYPMTYAGELSILNDFHKAMAEDFVKDEKIKKAWENVMRLSLSNEMLAVLHFHGERPRAPKEQDRTPGEGVEYITQKVKELGLDDIKMDRVSVKPKTKKKVK